MWIGHRLLVFLIDPRDVELILSSHVYIDKADDYKFFKPWLGNGLLISTGIHIYSYILIKFDGKIFPNLFDFENGVFTYFVYRYICIYTTCPKLLCNRFFRYSNFILQARNGAHTAN